MKRMKKPWRAAAAAAAVVSAATLALTGCGGGDDGNGNDGAQAPQSDPTVVPSSAMSSIAAFFAFAKALASSESAEPLSLAQAGTAPVSETDEPTPLPQ